MAICFPIKNNQRNPRTGVHGRYHVHESKIQKAVKIAVRQAKITKHVGPHTFRHYVESQTMPSRNIFL